MPWKESRTSDERLKFIAQVLSEAGGPAALEDLSRGPRSHSQSISESARERLIEMRQKHPRWGARKVRARLLRLEPNERWPSASTIDCAIAAAGLTKLPRKRRTVPYVQPLIEATKPKSGLVYGFQRKF